MLGDQPDPPSYWVTYLHKPGCDKQIAASANEKSLGSSDSLKTAKSTDISVKTYIFLGSALQDF